MNNTENNYNPSKIFFISTPRGKSHYYRMWMNTINEKSSTVKSDYIIKNNLINLDTVDYHLQNSGKNEDYRDGYSDGIIYAERFHNIRGKYE